MKKYEDFPSMVIFQFSPRKYNILTYFTLSLSASQVYMIWERCWFSQIDFFIEHFPHRINVLFPSSQFYVIHIHRQEQPFFTVYKQAFSIGNLFTLIRFSQITFPITVLPKDDRTDFAQEERLDLPYWTMILAICVVVDESKCLDSPILEFFTNL